MASIFEIINLNVYRGDRSFNAWKYRIRLLLEQQEVLNATETENCDEKEDNKAKLIIVLGLVDEILDCVKDCNTAFQMWRNFSACYERKDSASLIFF